MRRQCIWTGKRPHITRALQTAKPHSKYLVDGDSVGDAIASIQNDTGRTSGGVERQHGLNGYVHGRGVERLKHDLQAKQFNTLVRNNSENHHSKLIYSPYVEIFNLYYFCM